MLTERPIHIELRDMLLNNEPFAYAHLIKFERPSRPDQNGKTSTSRQRYTYLTDASRDVNFDDGSTNLVGIPNGSQTYIANKVLKVSGIAEQTEAKATSFSLVLDGNGIGAYVKVAPNSGIQGTVLSADIMDVKWPANVDLVAAGFREGDKVTFRRGAGLYAGTYNIVNFREDNVLRVSKIDDDLGIVTNAEYSMELSSEEIKSILLDKNLPEYASFVNREVFIYKAYFQEGQVVGSPVLLFKGIISGVGFDDTESNVQVTWTLTSHWGDFAQVKGRITSDDFHRALDQNGIPQPFSALKQAYAYDKGFSHSETSINLLATYQVAVEKQDVKAKKGFFGIGAKVKVKKYIVNEDRNTDLDFQLQAKSIPVIYGVRNTTGIPIFADTLNSDSSTVYVLHALSEGEIGGIYDIYIEGNSLICNDKADFDARSTQTADNTVELICRGRADRGDVLGGSSSVSTTPADFYAGQDYLYDFNYNLVNLTGYYQYVPPVTTVTDTVGRGVFDGQSIKLTSPQEISLDFFSGRAGQKAASQLVEIAKANGFKIQNDYWTGTDTAEYWGPNHRLLDTAYIVGKYKITEGETTIPSLEYIVKGKGVNCYNYDYSYSHYIKADTENSDNFKLGDAVTLYNTANVAISAPLQIIDKWTFVNPDGTLNTRFRFSAPPGLGYINGVPTITKFYMKNGANQTWTMVTYNFEEVRTTVGTTLATPLTGGTTSGDRTALSYSNSSWGGDRGGDPVQGGIPSVSVLYSNGSLYFDNAQFSSDVIIQGTSWTSGSYVTKLPSSYSSLAQNAAGAGTILVQRNTVRLSDAASSVDGYYNGYIIRVYRYDAVNDKQLVQEKKIIAYKGDVRTATIDDVWDAEYYPKLNDTVVIVPNYLDTRTSINPAMQTMDYITSPTYGKGLDVVRDLDLASWLEAGRVCDTQSNVTVLATGGTMPSLGHIYEYRDGSGNLLWQGQTVGSDGYYVEFTANIGKLTNGWNSWKSYVVGELVHCETRLYRVTTAGVKPTKPTHSGVTVNGLQWLSSLSITSINGGPTLSLKTDGNPIRALREGAKISGYSLYDCDEVDYFRLLGWDEFSQRYVTRHQTNLTIDTSLPLFDNINSLLEHFGGVLRYSQGKYFLEVEDSQGPIATVDSEVRNITSDHIIGKIRLSDEGVRGSFNSLTAAYADPANKFESRNISFFNSEYLKADRNVPKKGNVSVPGITNYYNTRILADKYLNKSRFGLTISFNMAPRGLLLLSGQVFQLQYPRYGWVDKKFRISTLTHQEDCTVDIVAEEYDDSFYILSKISKQAGSGLAGVSDITSIMSPTGLRATSLDNGDESYSGVSVTWINNPVVNFSKNVSTELYSSFSSKLYTSISSISGNVLTSSAPHELKAGELITSQTTINGLELGKSYFIKEIVSSTQFTLSENKGGAIKGLVDGTSLGAIMMTANLIANLPVPANSFVDVFGGVDGRVIKFYWVRHKVVQGY